VFLFENACRKDPREANVADLSINPEIRRKYEDQVSVGPSAPIQGCPVAQLGGSIQAGLRRRHLRQAAPEGTLTIIFGI